MPLHCGILLGLAACTRGVAAMQVRQEPEISPQVVLNDPSLHDLGDIDAMSVRQEPTIPPEAVLHDPTLPDLGDIDAMSVRQEPTIPPQVVLHDPILGDIAAPADEALPDHGIKHELDLAKYPNARCLDGTPGAYYYSPSVQAEDASGTRQFFIFRMGGGHCADYENCRTRSESMLGSSSREHGWGQTLNLGGVHGFPNSGFNRNPAANPLLWNWNHVYMIYCDGGYFAGTNSTPTYVDGKRVYFNGADIQDAVLHDLNERYGLRYATDIIIGGCSAGGIATYVTSDTVFRHPAIPSTARKAAFAFSGFFLSYDEVRSKWWHEAESFPWNVQNMSGSVSSKCLEDQPLASRCFIPEVATAYSHTPAFAWETFFDDYQLNYLYGDDCRSDPECVSYHKASIIEAMQEMWRRHPRFGGFLSGCPHHCEDSSLGDVGRMRPVDSSLPLQALALWYRAYVTGGFPPLPGQQRTWFQDADYPCRECCPAGPMGAHRHFLHDLE